MQDTPPLFFKNTPLESIWSNTDKVNTNIHDDNFPKTAPSRLPSPDSLIEREMRRTFEQITNSIDLIEEKEWIGKQHYHDSSNISKDFQDSTPTTSPITNIDTPPGLFIVKSKQRIIPNNSKTAFHSINSQDPPNDYLCKLCMNGGHWMKDCEYFEIRTHHSPPTTINSNGETIISRTSIPPNNYICRLCGIDGHWIEHCSKFKPKYDYSILEHKNLHQQQVGGGGPPKNYLCNICHKSGHWIQQCSDFHIGGNSLKGK